MKLKDEGLDEEAMDMIAAEDLSQRENWGFQEHSADVWFIILSEEVGELAAVLLQGDEPDLSALEEEATQIATVAIKIAYMARKAKLAQSEINERRRNCNHNNTYHGICINCGEQQY